jgi:hypothetical protein
MRRAAPVAGSVVVLVAVLTLTLAGAGAATPPAPAPPVTDASGVPVGNAAPVIGPAPARHHVVLGIGDSILAQGLFSLTDVWAAHGIDAEYHEAHINGSGILDTIDGATALQTFDRLLAAHPDADTVVFEWIGNCSLGCAPGKLAYGSPQFYDAWEGAVRAIVAHARAHGLQVLWGIGPPEVRPDPPDPLVEAWTSLSMRQQVAERLTAQERRYPRAFGIAMVDWFAALSDTSGQWQPQLSYDGAVHAVRADDKVHLSVDGAARTSAWAAAALVRLWASEPATRIGARVAGQVAGQVAKGKRSE